MAYFNLTEPVDVNVQGVVKNFPSGTEIAVGDIDGYRVFNKFAESTVISTSYVDIWPNASILSYLSSAETMHLSSTSGNDTSGGTGAQQVRVYGLDNDYYEIDEIVNLAGTGNSTTSKSFLRIYRMVVIQAGSGSANAGIITATATSAGTVQAYIGVGINQTLQSQYTVPANYYLSLTGFEITVQKGDQANIRGVVRPFGQTFQVKRVYNIYQSANSFAFEPPILIPPKSDISLRAIKISGAGNVTASCSYDGYLINSSLVKV